MSFNNEISYQLTSEDVAAGSPGYIAPLEVHFSPKGDLLTYLYPDASGKRQLYGIDLRKLNWNDQDSVRSLITRLNADTANEKLSLEEQLRRERMRLFVEGISTYEWNHSESDGEENILIPLGGKIYILYKGSSAEGVDFAYRFELIYDGSLGAAIDPHVSPNGKYVAFVLSNDIYLQEATPGAKPIRLTYEAMKDGQSCGVADYVAQEEMSRYRGFWWSPDSSKIAFTLNDESLIPVYEILHQGKEDPTHNETHRYPFAGKRNPKVRLGYLDVGEFASLAKSGSDSPVDIYAQEKHIFETLVNLDDTRFHTLQDDTKEVEVEYYICRVDWWVDNSIMVQVENRDQNILQLLRLDIASGERIILTEETTSVWINLHDLLTPLSTSYVYPLSDPTSANPADFYFIWASERSGFMQLYLYVYDAAQKKGVCLSGDAPIGVGGEWVVEGIEAVDEANHRIYYSGNYSNWTESHLVSASFLPDRSRASFQPITTHMRGYHSCKVNVKHGVLTDVRSSPTEPLTFTLYALTPSGAVTTAVVLLEAVNYDNRLIRKPQLLSGLVTPILYTIPSKPYGENGTVAELQCAIYLPKEVDWQQYLDSKGDNSSNKKKYPAIVAVYGGPHVQRVSNSWMLTVDMRAQRLAQNGYIVVKCDNRGSSRRGLAFEGPIYHNMGDVEIIDQVQTVDFLVQELGIVDSARVGMYGWSYGGYMSAMSLCKAPNTFTCSVAGAPVTSWDGYDTHYTERYMGRPQENIPGYNTSSVMNYVNDMKGRLLLVHGLIDENVHFRHTARLINALIQQRKRYELVLFPCERHSPHKLQDRIYLEDIIMDFFANNLLK